jgi:hypothetical protein
VTVSRLDNWAETEITTDSARQLIESGKIRLPNNAKMTLAQLKQNMENAFPRLG